MKKLKIVHQKGQGIKQSLITLFVILCLSSGCKMKANPKPFNAKVVSVMTKIDGTGYAIVLQAVDDPNIWAAAVTVEKLKNGDIVTVDKAEGKILSNDGIEGKILDK